jgi:hypothetical protein
MEWLIKLESSDKNILEIKCKAPNEQQASAVAQERIIELGWTQYQYKLKQIIPILKGKIQYGKEKN